MRYNTYSQYLKERYGEKSKLNAKVEAQVREIRLQELNELG